MPSLELHPIVAALRAAGCVYAEDEARLLRAAAGTPAELGELLERRLAGVPLADVLGWAEFFGLRLAVDDGVFVPRLRTELVVREAATLLAPRAVVVDLCCGSGAVAVALDSLLPGLELYASDIDPVAVRCARRNLGERARVFEGDLYQALPPEIRGRVDVIVVNAPYVPSASIETMPREARLHEARRALDGGGDGLDVHRRVAAAARRWLAPAGHLVIETSERQAALTAQLLATGGLVPRTVFSTELDATVVVAAVGAAPGQTPSDLRISSSRWDGLSA